MYELLREYLLRFLRVPAEPADPMGDVGSLLVFRASWNFFRYRFVFWIFTALAGLFSTLLVPLLGLWYFYAALLRKGKIHSLSMTVIVIIAAGLILYALVQVIVSYLALRLDYELRWYKVSDRSLRIREGVFNLREVTMTFANIQNIEIIQGPIQRMFGIADLKVETAGGGGLSAVQTRNDRNQPGLSFHIAYFRGIENAVEIRDLMRARLEKIRSGGLGDDPEHELPPDAFVRASVAGDAALNAQTTLELLREVRDAARELRLTASGV